MFLTNFQHFPPVDGMERWFPYSSKKRKCCISLRMYNNKNEKNCASCSKKDCQSYERSVWRKYSLCVCFHCNSKASQFHMNICRKVFSKFDITMFYNCDTQFFQRMSSAKFWYFFNNFLFFNKFIWRKINRWQPEMSLSLFVCLIETFLPAIFLVMFQQRN